jgi:hypothetical protein
MKSAAANQALHPEGCLFCRRHDGGFLSEEHIFSEGLGNMTTYFHRASCATGAIAALSLVRIGR